jgi:hypothetical protein
VLQNELIIQCQQFTRWLHAACDFIRNEREAKFCAKDGYTCVLCRSPDQQPPHLHPSNASVDALTLAPPPLVSVLAASNQAGNRQNRQSSSATPPPSPVPGPLQKLAGRPLYQRIIKQHPAQIPGLFFQPVPCGRRFVVRRRNNTNDRYNWTSPVAGVAINSRSSLTTIQDSVQGDGQE